MTGIEENMNGGGATTASPASSVEGAVMPSPQFPDGLRVLVVDDDPTCLMIMGKMLRTCKYEVTTCSHAIDALSMLRERKGGFDLVLSDVHMPDMDGFKLLENIGLEMDLPVIMMSADDSKNVVMKGITHGACDYLIKPVRIEAVKNIWQHVVRKRRTELKDLEQSGGSAEDNDKKSLDDGDYASSPSEGSRRDAKRRNGGREGEIEFEDHEDSSTLKKPRVVWASDLHQKFLACVNQLGVDKAVPKKILEMMNVQGLTRENVASHLQKYRLYLRRVSDVPQHQGRLTGAPEAVFGSVGSLDGFDLQPFSLSGQLPAQSVMTLQVGSRSATATGIAMPLVDQMDLFNSKTQILNSSGISSAQGQHLSNKQKSFFHGPSATAESRQLGQSQQAIYGNMSLQASQGLSGFMDLPTPPATGSLFLGGTINGCQNNSLPMQMTQQRQQLSLAQHQNHMYRDTLRKLQARGDLLGGIAGGHEPEISSTMGQRLLPNEVSGHLLGTAGIRGSNVNGGTLLPGTHVNTTSYCAFPQTSCADLPNNCITESSGSHYFLANCIGASNLTSTGMVQEAISAAGSLEALDSTTGLKGVRGFIQNVDIFSELPQSKTQDWKLRSMNRTYESAQKLGSRISNIDFGSAILAHQAFPVAKTDGNNRNTCTETLSIRTEVEGKVVYTAQRNSTALVENSLRVKDDLSREDVLSAGNIIPNELMNVIRKQQESDGQIETYFNFDGYQ